MTLEPSAFRPRVSATGRTRTTTKRRRALSCQKAVSRDTATAAPDRNPTRAPFPSPSRCRRRMTATSASCSRPVGVVMSMRQYERLRGAAWERLTDTLDRLGAEAAARGLTDARLDALLADDG